MRTPPSRYALFLPAAAALHALLSAACGSTTITGTGGGSTTSGTGGGGATSSTTTSSTTTSSSTTSSSTTTSSSSSGGATCDPQCQEKLTCAPNSEFCMASAVPVDCNVASMQDVVQVCGVPLGDFSLNLLRSAGVKEYAGNGPPDVGCYAPSGYPTAGAPQNVTMSGVAHIFAHGCQSKSVTIEVHTVKRTGGPDDGEVGPLIGSAVTTAADCMATGVATSDDDCGTRYECKYSYAGVPTETELLIKTSGSLWAPVYEYNVYLRNAEVQNGVVSRNVRVVATDDYVVMPQAAIGGPIAPGDGMVLGEVHDCGDVRLLNAVVDVDRQAKIVTYFTSNESKPLPNLAATATTDLGLYAALDIVPGAIRVAAVGRAGGPPQTIGFTRARVFPDSISLVTFHGLLPFQVP